MLLYGRKREIIPMPLPIFHDPPRETRRRNIFDTKLIDKNLLQELIQCACGHGISVHASDGCQRHSPKSCSCSLSESDVLNHAILAVRDNERTTN